MSTDEKPVQPSAAATPLLSQERYDVRNDACVSGLLSGGGEEPPKAQSSKAMFPPEVEQVVNTVIEATIPPLCPPADCTEKYEGWIVKLVYRYARKLKSIDMVRELDASDPRVWEMGKKWEKACTTYDLSTYGPDFVPILLVRSWQGAFSTDRNEAKRTVFKKSRNMPLPKWLEGFPPQVKAVASLCLAWESALGGEGRPFHLSCRVVMEFLEFWQLPRGDPKYTNRILKFLCNIGFLELLTRGESIPGARPSKFRILRRDSFAT